MTPAVGWTCSSWLPMATSIRDEAPQRPQAPCTSSASSDRRGGVPPRRPLAAFGIVFLTVFPPTLLVADTWLTLVAGREVVEHGLPSATSSPCSGSAATWTDQQWGAQLLAYGVARARRPRTARGRRRRLRARRIRDRRRRARARSAPARARSSSSSSRCSWRRPGRSRSARRSSRCRSSPGSSGCSRRRRGRPTRRVYLVFPLLVVWANIHGSVALAAMLTMLLGAIELVPSRGRSGLRSVALVVLSPLALLATPYGPVDDRALLPPAARRPAVRPRARHRVAAQRPELGHARLLPPRGARARRRRLGRRRLTLFDMAALALTFAGAVLAIRGIPWFALACLVLVPVALGPRARGTRRSASPRALDRALSYGAVAVLAARRGRSRSRATTPGT